MFISRKGLMKLMTQAYKGAGGLKVRNGGVGLSISGISWSVYFLWPDLPKEVMGDLISLVDKLPEEEECYEASPEGNQMVMYDDEELNAMAAGLQGGPELKQIPLVLLSGGAIQILQVPNIDRPEIVLVDQYKLGLIRPADINSAAGEEPPTGPLQTHGMVEARFNAAATWVNNQMGFSIGYAQPVGEYTEDIAHILDNHLLWRESNGRAAEVFGKETD